MQDNRFDRSIPHAVTCLFREQNRRYGRVVEPFGVSAEQAHLLTLLWTRGPLSMGELGREAALSSGTLSAAIDRMEAAGLVARVKDPEDGRGVRVEAAKWPAAKRERLLGTLLAAEEEMLANLSERERATLHTLLTRVLATFRRE
ncbi:MAG TPA: MarR family transcriptional regulator [Polyangiaceae bacterium]